MTGKELLNKIVEYFEITILRNALKLLSRVIQD
jgi:hypothetical protein